MRKFSGMIFLLGLLFSAVLLSGCEEKSSNDAIEVSVTARAFTSSRNVSLQETRFDFSKNGENPTTFYRTWGDAPEDDDALWMTATAIVGYNIHPGDSFTVTMYNSVASPTTQTQTYT